MQKHLRCLKWKLAWRLTLMDAMGSFFFIKSYSNLMKKHMYDRFSNWKIFHFKNDNYLLQKYFEPSAIVAFKGLPCHLRLWIHVCSQNPLLSIFSCQTKFASNTAILLKLKLWHTKSQINMIQKKNKLYITMFCQKNRKVKKAQIFL